MGTAIVNKSGPNLLIRFVWWLFIGWWASGIVVGIAWIALVTIVGIPLGIWLINRLPTVLTLRPRTRAWSIGQEWMGAAWLVQLTIIGLPIALLMFNRTPFVASLYRY